MKARGVNGFMQYSVDAQVGDMPEKGLRGTCWCEQYTAIFAVDGLADSPKTAEGAISLYDSWAESYDESLRSWGYEAPEKTAQLLSDYWGGAHARTICQLDKLPILDCGCGTGLSSAALAASGFKNI